MNWKTITAAATPGSIDHLEQLLWDAGAVSVTVEDGGDQPILEPAPAETPLWDEIAVMGLFREEIDPAGIARALIAAGFTRVEVGELADRVWEREWLTRFKPTRFGQRLWVCPTEYDAPPGAEIVMRLDPGLAFGTGTHSTTRLCLEWLDAHVEPGMRIVDYGCGSGILGIAALLLSAASVLAVDNDPQALTATTANARSNGVIDRLCVCTPQAVPAGSWDLVVANILAQPLIELAPGLQGLLAVGGRLALSGIMRNQVERVMHAYPGIAFSATSHNGEWACLSGTLR